MARSKGIIREKNDTQKPHIRRIYSPRKNVQVWRELEKYESRIEKLEKKRKQMREQAKISELMQFKENMDKNGLRTVDTPYGEPRMVEYKSAANIMLEYKPQGLPCAFIGDHIYDQNNSDITDVSRDSESSKYSDFDDEDANVPDFGDTRESDDWVRISTEEVVPILSHATFQLSFFLQCKKTCARKNSISERARKALNNMGKKVKKIIKKISRNGVIRGAALIVWKTSYSENAKICSMLAEQDTVSLLNQINPTLSSLIEVKERRNGEQSCFARKDIKKEKAVIASSGILFSEDILERVIDSEDDYMIGANSTRIDLDLLKEFGYDCDIKLAIEDSMFGNEATLFQDPSWPFRDCHEREANVGAFLALSPEYGPRIVYFTLKAIKKGEEMLVAWGERAWARICNLHIPRFASHSRQLFKVYQNLLERNRPHSFNHSKGETFMNESGESNALTVQKQNIGADMMTAVEEIKDAKKVFSYLEVEDQNQFAISWTDSKGILTEPLERVKRSDSREYANYKDQRVIDLLSSDSKEILTRVKVVQVDPECLTHPAVYCCTPEERVQALIAMRKFKKLEPVVEMGGEVVTEEEADEISSSRYLQTFFFDDDLQSHVLINGEKSFGGAINDNWAPSPLPKREPNVGTPKVIWYRKRPHVVLFATKAIAEGEEIISEYGPKYWQVMWKQIMIKHELFCEDMRKKIECFKQ